MSSPAPRRLLLLSEPYPPRHPGGAGNYTRTLARALAARGHQVDVVCVDPALSEVSTEDGVAIHRLRVSEDGWSARLFEGRRRRLLPYLRDLHRQRRFELVHDVGGFLYADTFRDFCAETGLPGISHLLLLMGPYLAEIGAPRHLVELFHDLQTLQCGASAAVITTSRAEQAFYRRFFTTPVPERMIPNAVTVGEPGLAPVLSWRRRLAADGAVVLFIGGRLGDRVKGGDRACALAAALWQRGVPVRLVGTDLRASETPRAIAGALLGLGRLPEEDFLAVLQAADLVLCPSRYEAFGLLAVEAAALGTPVFASRVGGHLDTLPALGGWLLEDGAWESPGPAVVDYVAGLAGRWTPRSRRPLPEELTPEGAAGQMEDVYRSVLREAA